MKFALPVLCLCVAILPSIFAGCTPAAPMAQVNHYEIGYCKSYGQAWSVARDILVAHELTTASAQRPDGYYRTDWLYRKYQKPAIDIRVRFILNYLPDRPVLRVTPEVEFLGGEPVLYRSIPIVNDVLAELDQRLRCAGDEPPRP